MQSNNTSYNLRAKFYDLEFNDTADRKLLTSLITPRIKRILEIPCGSGRNCDWLAKTEKEIVFGDLSSEMIEVVKIKLNKLPFSHSAIAECADIMTYQSLNPFDLILIPREGLQIFQKTQLVHILNNLKSNLSKEGVIYLDLASLNLEYVEQKYKLPKYIAEQENEYVLDIEIQTDDCYFKRWHQSQFIHESLQVHFRYEVIEQGKKHEYTSTLTLMNYDYEYLASLCQNLGFTITNVYGGYDKKRYSINSERLIFFLKKSQ